MQKEQLEIEKISHSLAHLLAMAVLKSDPQAKLAIGPSIENGFYYDFELSKKLEEKDLQKLQKEIKKLITQKIEFKKEEITKEKAQEIFKDQPYKLELLEEIEKPQIYQSGEFIDLCEGPHITNTSEINPDAFKLTKIAGAYWRGDEKNKMLTRIYGIAFQTEKELEKHLKQQEEAEKRDHRKLGKELDLFTFSDLVGPGLPLYTPKGVAIIEELKKHIESICRKYGFQKVSAPSLSKIELFEISGHAQKFKDELFHVSSKKKHDFVLKPVQCPHHTQIYASKTRSYRDLPIKYMESDKQYRAEKSGEVGGLNRVYAITIEDGHTFCTKDQIKDELRDLVNIVKDFYSALGLWGDHWVSLSVRDYSHPEKYIGDSKDWDICENVLQEISDEMKLNAKKCEGEAALYGPKLDFIFKDALGKEIQIPTIQLDFATPKRFNLFYINKEGKEEHPIMIHRAILGSYERFLALLIEHFVGAFPFWLSPVQIKILSISDKHKEYAQKIHEQLFAQNFRTELDISDENLGKKVRKAKTEKIPYILILGDKELEEQNITIESRDEGNLGQSTLEDFITKISKE